jgi:hypothetical protein
MLLRQMTAKIIMVMGNERFEYVAEGRSWILVLNFELCYILYLDFDIMTKFW